MTEIKHRIKWTREQKRVAAEEATRFVFEDNEKRRCLAAMKTARLRALRLATERPSGLSATGRNCVND